MNSDRELERAVRDWLVEGWDRLPGQYLDAALDEISTTRQRRFSWPAWRPFEMTTQLRLGLAAVVVALLALLGFYLIGSRPQPPHPAVLPTNRIVYVGTGDGPDDAQIWVADADGGGAARLTNTPPRGPGHPAFEAFPAWSPDRKKIAFTSARDSDDTWDLYIMDADGSNQIRLATTTDTAFGPSFSPDGRTIVFTGGNGVWVVNADGTGLRQLTEGSQDGAAHFSPDGRWIVYGGATHLYAMKADGSSTRRLTGGTATDALTSPPDGDPAWSPDGSHIVFDRGPEGHTDIFVMAFDPTATGVGPDNAVQLTRAGGVQPSWSPDGSFIVFVGPPRDPADSGSTGLVVMYADGSGQTQLGNPQINGWAPAWS